MAFHFSDTVFSWSSAKIMVTNDAGLIRLLFSVAGLVFFLILELAIPYRPTTVSKLQRWINNISLAIFNSVVVRLFFAGAILQTAFYVQEKQFGTLNLISVPYWTKIVARWFSWISYSMSGIY
jgi:hypothetical protein